MSPTNPKDALGSNKLPIHLWPAAATALGSLGLLEGDLKYGRNNFRATPIRASVYYDACIRHLQGWMEGEDQDPDSGLPHLAHALACLGILADAWMAGTLVDDRNMRADYRKFVNELTPHVARLKQLHAGKNPKRYTIQDSPPAEPETLEPGKTPGQRLYESWAEKTQPPGARFSRWAELDPLLRAKWEGDANFTLVQGEQPS